MPLSIFNSNSGNWVKSWILALLLAVAILAGLEYFWRANGHRPAVVDDQRLWAIERSKIGKEPKEIVLLGSSRMQTDISINTLRHLAPDHAIINLAADGTCANASLYDLANDHKFRGTVIVEITPECIMFGDKPGLSQQFYVDYFHKTFNLTVEINRRIATFVQKRLVIIDPYLNLIKVTGDKIVKNKWRQPNYLITHEDRSRSADYTKLDIEHHKKIRIKKIKLNYDNLSRSISIQALTYQIAALDNAVQKIHKRGGKVVFARFPVSDEHWTLDEQYFPHNKYWAAIIPLTIAKVLHFKDIDGINDLQCPDTSHLDVRDTTTFTTQLFNEIL